MTEAHHGQDFEISDLQQRAEKTVQTAQELSSAIERDFLDENTRRLLGQVFFGQATKTQQKEDGTIEEVVWTPQDFDEYWEQGLKEQEKSIRKSMAREMVRALETQTVFFDTTEHPKRKESSDNIEFIAALMERFLASDEVTSDPYPVGGTAFVSETYWETEMLEVIRRIILRPTYVIYDGYAKNGINSVPGYFEDDFEREREELITPEMKEVRAGDLDEYFRLEEVRIEKALEERSDEEWAQVVDSEGYYLKGYIQKCIARAASNARGNTDFAARLVHKGKRVFPDEVVKFHKEKAKELEEIWVEVAKIEDFSGILPWIKQRFGEDASYRSFLLYLNPIDLEDETVET